MIGSVIKNSSVNTKVHAKMRGMLKNADYEKMVGMKSVPKIAEFLKTETRYGDCFGDLKVESIHRGQLEACLRKPVMRDLHSFLAFSGTSAKFFLSLFAMREEIRNIKIALRFVNSGTGAVGGMTMPEGEFYNNIDFAALAAAENTDAFIDMLRPTVYGKALVGFRGGNMGIFEIELALDSFYRKLAVSYMSKYLSKQETEIVEKTLGEEADLDDIVFIIRAKEYYNMSREMIYPHIGSKGGHLTHEELAAMVEAADSAALAEAVAATRYAELFREGIEGAEMKIEKRLLKLHRRLFCKNPYSIEAILYYIRLKETEIKNITMVVEGIRYGLEPSAIMSCLILKN